MYRSRLQKLEERRNLRQATLLSLGTILVIVAAVVLGIPLLIRMAVFLADLNSSNRPVDKNDLIPPMPPQISLPYDATNSARQTISGSAEPGSAVFLTLNGESAADVVAAEDGSFSIPDVTLAKGENKLSAIAIDQAGNKSTTSTEIILLYVTEPPKLQIQSPTDHQQTSDKSITVAGETSPGARLTINDRLVIVNSDGKFSTQYNLSSGNNVLVIIASDRAGNQTRKELTVTATP